MEDSNTSGCVYGKERKKMLKLKLPAMSYSVYSLKGMKSLELCLVRPYIENDGFQRDEVMVGCLQQLRRRCDEGLMVAGMLAAAKTRSCCAAPAAKRRA
ncbi:unnamed protein product [Prunus armeniaca]